MAIIIPPLDRTETDVSDLFRWRTTRRIVVDLGEPLFETRLAGEADRMRQVFRGFERLAAAGTMPESLAIIGTGSGVEAIGAAHIFPSLRRLILTGNRGASLARAAQNVAANIDRGIEVKMLPSSILALPSGLRVDIAYADLLNMPFSAAPDVAVDRFLPHPPVTLSGDDVWLNRCQMAIPLGFLSSVRTLLAPGGCALVLLGGRVGYEALDRMAEAARIRLELVVSGFKRQIDAGTVLSGYAAAEGRGIEFEFYDYHAGRRRLDGMEDLSGSALEAILAPWRVTARDALRAFQIGRPIGHSYHLLKAMPMARTASC